MFRNPVVDAAVVLIVVLLIFGPKRLPMLGRSLGQGMREFKDSITGESKDGEEVERPELTESSAVPRTAPSPPPAAAPAVAPERDSVPGSARESAEVGPRDERS